MLGKAVNVDHGLGMKVPCRIPLFTEGKYINLLKDFNVEKYVEKYQV